MVKVLIPNRNLEEVAKVLFQVELARKASVKKKIYTKKPTKRGFDNSEDAKSVRHLIHSFVSQRGFGTMTKKRGSGHVIMAIHHDTNDEPHGHIHAIKIKNKTKPGHRWAFYATGPNETRKPKTGTSLARAFYGYMAKNPITSE